MNNNILSTKLPLVVFACATLASGSALSKENAKDQTSIECDPIIELKVENKSRSEVLKQLAETYGFQVISPESQDKLITVDKKEALSKVIESITRNASVSYRYGKVDGCQKLTKLAFVKEGEWNGSGTAPEYRNDASNTPLPLNEEGPARVFAPRTDPYLEPRAEHGQADFTPVPVSEYELEAEEIYPDEEREAKEKERQEALERERERLEEKRRLKAEMNDKTYQPKVKLNNIVEGGEELNANYYRGRKNWRAGPKPTTGNPGSSGGRAELDVENMDNYVREVLEGERVPTLDQMNAKERFEYMESLKRIQE